MIAILGHKDAILYEAEIPQLKKTSMIIDYLVAFAALDKIDAESSINSNLYLSLLKSAHECHLYGYTTFSGIRFLLMSAEKIRNEDQVRNFFTALHKMVI